jgi:hypothetical protein
MVGVGGGPAPAANSMTSALVTAVRLRVSTGAVFRRHQHLSQNSRPPWEIQCLASALHPLGYESAVFQRTGDLSGNPSETSSALLVPKCRAGLPEKFPEKRDCVGRHRENERGFLSTPISVNVCSCATAWQLWNTPEVPRHIARCLALRNHVRR